MFDALELRDGCLRAAGGEVEFASDDELFAAARTLWAARAAFDAADLHVLGELDARGSCDRVFGLRTGRGWRVRRVAILDCSPVGWMWLASCGTISGCSMTLCRLAGSGSSMRRRLLGREPSGCR